MARTMQTYDTTDQNSTATRHRMQTHHVVCRDPTCTDGETIITGTPDASRREAWERALVHEYETGHETDFGRVA